MSKKDILNLTEEDLKILDKFQNLAKSKLKKDCAGAIRAMDYIWEKLIQNDNNINIKILCKNGVNSWRDLTENQICQLPQSFYHSTKALDTKENELLEKIDELKKQIDVLQRQVESLEKENELLKEKANLKLPKDAEDIKYLVERDLILKKLEFWGVDNWGGYEDAINWVFKDGESKLN